MFFPEKQKKNCSRKWEIKTFESFAKNAKKGLSRTYGAGFAREARRRAAEKARGEQKTPGNHQFVFLKNGGERNTPKNGNRKSVKKKKGHHTKKAFF